MFHWIASGNKSALIIIIFCSCIYNVSFLIWLVLCFVFIFPLSLAFTTWLSYEVCCMSLWFCCVSLKFLHPMVISQFSSVQSLSHVRLFATPWIAAHQASLSIANSWSLLRFMSIESVIPSNHLILCRPLLLPPSIFPSIRVFSSESVLHIRWPKMLYSTYLKLKYHRVFG